MKTTSLLLALAIAGAPARALAAAPPAASEPAEPTTAEPTTAPATETPPPAAGDAPEGEVTEDTPGADTSGLVLDPKQADLEIAARLYDEGSDAFETGKYEVAITKFQEAFELSREPKLLYNIGQAHWKWFDVDPQLDHLRQAAIFFRNYDKRLRLTEGYDPTEVDNILKAIDAQIENEERKIAERNRPVIVAPSGPTEDEVRREQRRRTTKGLNISGTTLIVVGGVTLGMGLAGLVTRSAYSLILKGSTNEGEGGVNLATAEEDRDRRQGYLVGGQVAFAGFVMAGIILPVGITLRVIGAVRDKRDRDDAKRRDGEREKLDKLRGKPAAKVRIDGDLGGIIVRF